MAIVILEHSPKVGAGRLGAVLRDHGHRLRVVALHEDETVPRDLDDIDGIVTTGGPQSAQHDHPWAAPEMELLRAADDEALPIVGICLGSQVLARALGGEVGPVQGGIELGWHEVTLSPQGAEDPVHTGQAWTSTQLQWHREQVSRPPPGARVLAHSARCPVQAWARGLRTYGFQYHPEVAPETIEAWAADGPADLREAGISLQQLRDATARHYPAFERLSQRLFESIALFLMPADRRIAGVARDIHH